MKQIVAVGVSLFMMVMSGCAPAGPQVDTAADKATIEKLYPAWVETSRSRDLEAFASFLAPDAQFLPPNVPALKTHEEIVEFYRALYEDPRFALDCHQQQVEVAAAGDIAWSRGSCDGTFTGQDGEAVHLRSKWLKVWQKQPNDEWKNLVNMWNSDLPAAPAGE